MALSEQCTARQAFGWGMLNRYLYGHRLALAEFPARRDCVRGTDEVQYIDFDTNSDKCCPQLILEQGADSFWPSGPSGTSKRHQGSSKPKDLAAASFDLLKLQVVVNL